MIIGKKQFAIGEKVYVMGILNVTPDSFSDGGLHNTTKTALETVEEFVQSGCDIVDVGGESTRPGHVQITQEEEISRVKNIIVEIKRRFDIPISIDTYKARVARAACDAGADLINDIWGFKYDDQMAHVAKEYGSAVCLMHNRTEAKYNDFMADVMSDLKESIAIAKAEGIEDDRIIVDPGVGFPKSYEQNLMVMKHLEEFKTLGYPVLLGVSRKSMIGLATNRPVTEREAGTVATTVYGAMKGCDFVRVHNVKDNVDALTMLSAINQVKGV